MPENFNGRHHVCHRTMTYFRMNVEIIDQTIQAVSSDFREGFFCELAGAELPALVRISQTLKLTPDKRVIEFNIMGYKNAVFCDFHNLTGYFIKKGCFTYHFVGDAGQVTDEGRNTHFRIDQGFEGVDHFFTVVDGDGYFSDASDPGVSTSSFYVDDGIFSVGCVHSI